ncbi:hypothetical protein DNJ73_05340 [Prochlorococcus marinus XMU1408]|uniref:Bacteriophage T5 Orf172 DNA-binding domain-containing protein n=2 Tax=Prochlorococcus marinus TaxID=1219 RepID=A0A318R6J1_PROMR|nr:hypothetical protein [Prochlorococcus marinus str. XMU1408]PYE03162.1 hypothetical protein DNJ73_05340 [Prochlorococcus marinus XMU1408]
MSGWLYLIKNGNLYKIGITKNLDNRMRQLKPDYIVAKLYSDQFKKLEKEFHQRYKNVRIPQTEYFRLDQKHIREIKRRINKIKYSKRVILENLIKSCCLLLCMFFIVLTFMYLTVNDLENILYRSLSLMEKISYFFSFITLFLKSDKYLSFWNEIKYRLSSTFIFFLSALFFKVASVFLL